MLVINFKCYILSSWQKPPSNTLKCLHFFPVTFLEVYRKPNSVLCFIPFMSLQYNLSYNSIQHNTIYFTIHVRKKDYKGITESVNMVKKNIKIHM